MNYYIDKYEQMKEIQTGMARKAPALGHAAEAFVAETTPRESEGVSPLLDSYRSDSESLTGHYWADERPGVLADERPEVLPESNDYLPENEFTYGVNNEFCFTNDDLRSIYADCFESEFEAYVSNLKTGTLFQQFEMTNSSSVPLELYDMLETCAMMQHESQIIDDSAFPEVFCSVSEQEYLFHPLEWDELAPNQASYLDPESIIEDPHVVMLASRNGVAVPIPTGLVLVKSIQGKSSSRMLRCLFDTGSTKSHAHVRLLPPNTTLEPTDQKMLSNTLAGLLAPIGTMTLEGLRLPEFDRSITLDEHTFQAFSTECSYDLIIGMDLLHRLGMLVDTKHLTLTCFDQTLPMNTSNFTRERLEAFIDCSLLEEELDFMAEDFDSLYATEMSESKYEKTDLNKFVEEKCSHLDMTQQQQLLTLLRKHEKLFDGSLGCYPDMEMDIQLKPDAQPVWRRPYPVPHNQLELFRHELERLVKLGVLAPVMEPTSWGLPTFCIPKKPEPDGTVRVRWVSDLRLLNKMIVPYNYTLPIITDILRKHQGYKYCTALDLSMQFYCFKLTKAAQDIAVINTPFGPYRYLRAPMGLRNTPGFAQAMMETVLRDIDEADCYLDDIGIFSPTWEKHLQSLDQVLSRLEEKGFTMTPIKCIFGVSSMEWLGYVVTPEGLRPNKKKIDAILQMAPPRTAGDVRTFLGMVNFYRDMYPRRSHLLSKFYSLAKPTDKRGTHVEWTLEHDLAFKELKAVPAKEVLMAFPSHNKPFHIYTDASDTQLGACIMQDDRPVAYYSKKLNPAQRNYSTMEKELLALVMTLKEFRSMLLGAELHCYTDHKNLTYTTFNCQRVMRWRSYIEEYNPSLYFLAGKLNVLADAYSRLPRFDGLGAVEVDDALDRKPIPIDPMAEVLLSDSLFVGNVDLDIYECLSYYTAPDGCEVSDESIADLNCPQAVTGYGDFAEDGMFLINCLSSEQNPLNYRAIREAQLEDEFLQQRAQNPANPYYQVRLWNEVELISHNERPDDDASLWKIALPEAMVDTTIKFFHHLCNHPSHSVLTKTMEMFFCPNLPTRIKNFVCSDCQYTKSNTKGYGHHPPREVNLSPWFQVDVDLIGPWKFELRGGKEVEFLALTCIDRATGFPAGAIIDRKTSQFTADAFDTCWLSIFPRPHVCCSDNGKEFIGEPFEDLLLKHAIAHHFATVRNPSANGIVERMHLSMGNSLRVLLKDQVCTTQREARALLQKALNTALYSVRTNVSEATGNSPGALAFHRNMFYDIPLKYNMQDINERRQLRVDYDTMRANKRRYSYDYQVNQRVLKNLHRKDKLQTKWVGPYSISQIHVNGTVTLNRGNGLSERINIRRIKPYREPTTVDNT